MRLSASRGNLGPPASRSMQSRSDRDTIDLAVLDAGTGRVHAHLVDTVDGAGYRRILAWAGVHAPSRRVWALEGTGSFAAGLVVFLHEAGERVVEVGALKRARGAKNDRIDAIRAAREAPGRDQQTAPRAGGLREALRMVSLAGKGFWSVVPRRSTNSRV